MFDYKPQVWCIPTSAHRQAAVRIHPTHYITAAHAFSLPAGLSATAIAVAFSWAYGDRKHVL